jgi:hypothetical protein
MIDKAPGWKDVARINCQFIGAVLAFGYGYAAWQMASKPWWGLWLIGGLAMFAGGMMFLRAFFELIGVYKRHRKLKTFGKDSVDARADRAPDHADLKDRGMTR